MKQSLKFQLPNGMDRRDPTRHWVFIDQAAKDRILGRIYRKETPAIISGTTRPTVKWEVYQYLSVEEPFKEIIKRKYLGSFPKLKDAKAKLESTVDG